jgi:carbamoyltransferase
MYTLGINAAYHDSSACLVKDGKVVAAAEEERFTHIKHGKRPVPFSAYELPFHSIHYCLSHEDIRLIDLDHVAYSYDPFILLGQERISVLKLPLSPAAQPPLPAGGSPWDPLFLSYTVNAPRQLADGVPHALKNRFQGALPGGGPYQWHFVNHHTAHAASAFFVSPFEEAAIMTIDGRGEQATTSYGIGRKNAVKLIGGVNMPHSLGLLYERITSHLGFLHSSDEYKVMALASFGKPAYRRQFEDMITFNGSGGYRIRAVDLTDAFGPPRLPGAPFEKRHYNLARSLQAALEYTVLRLAAWLHEETRMDCLCMAGGVALNCVLNAALRDRGPFKKIWIQPAAGDAGTALGAAMHIDARERKPANRADCMDHVYLGPSYSDEEIESFLKRSGLAYGRISGSGEEVAELLVRDAVVGWFQGRMEFGPRALGARSILASPLHASMQAKLNELKDREDFRPVAPVVLEEEAENWFAGAGPSPFMLFVYKVRPEKTAQVPAICHADGTARIQTVNRTRNERYYDVIKAFQKRTGVPILVNTSFNTRGKPIVCSPRDAIECFYSSPLDALAIGSFLLKKPGAVHG